MPAEKAYSSPLSRDHSLDASSVAAGTEPPRNRLEGALDIGDLPSSGEGYSRLAYGSDEPFCKTCGRLRLLCALACALVAPELRRRFAGARAHGPGAANLWDKVMSTVGLGGAKRADQAPSEPAPIRQFAPDRPGSGDAVSGCTGPSGRQPRRSRPNPPRFKPFRPLPPRDAEGWRRNVNGRPRRPPPRLKSRACSTSFMRAVGLGKGPSRADSIDYSERPKIGRAAASGAAAAAAGGRARVRSREPKRGPDQAAGRISEKGAGRRRPGDRPARGRHAKEKKFLAFSNLSQFDVA